MKSVTYNVLRYDADEGKVFDWAEPRYIEVENEAGEIEQVQQHLYAKTLFLGASDSIDNYIEVDAQ